MGQQMSAAAAAEGVGQGASISHHSSTPPEFQTKSDNVEAGRPHPNPAWRNMYSAKGDHVAPSALADSGKNKIDADASRMSIRAAIDSFIENCLSSSNDFSPGDKKDGQSGSAEGELMNGERKINDDSRHSELSKDGSFSQTESQCSDCTDKCSQDNDLEMEEKQLVIDCTDSSTNNMDDQALEKSDHAVEVKNEKLKDSKKDMAPGGADAAHSHSSNDKQSFSAYLQDKLKKVDIDKHEELNQLAQNKDIHGQILMWEMTKKPPSCPENVDSAPGPSPVRLQTLIDKVLDSSLNNQDLTPSANIQKSKEDDIKKPPDSDKSLKEKQNEKDNRMELSSSVYSKPKQDAAVSEKSEATNKPAKSTLCFKDHIEKVLLESFLSYEEEERREALKRGENPDKQSPVITIETDTERQAARREAMKPGPDRTISVQDIVDRVISETDVISKLMTSATTDGKPAATEVVAPVATSAASPHPALKYATTQNKALLEAQKHAVQKEHHSANIGRKRGRPRLGSPMNNPGVWLIPDKDGKPIYADHRNRDLRNANHIDRANGSTGHPRQGPPPLDYAPHGSHNYGPMGLPTIVASKSSSMMFHQRHHPSQVRVSAEQAQVNAAQSMSSAASMYHQHTQDTFQQRSQQLSASAQQRSQHPGHSAKPPPPLILADHLGDSSGNSMSRLVQVSHIPTKTCSCHSCIAHFSREKSPSRSAAPHHLRHPGKPDPAPHPSLYHPYQTQRHGAKEYYPHQVPSGNESLRQTVPSQTLSQQAMIPNYPPAHRQHDAPTNQPQMTRESTARYYDPKTRNPSPGHYLPYPNQLQPSSLPKSTESLYAESDRHRHPQIPDHYEAVVPRREVPREKHPQPVALSVSKVVPPLHVLPQEPAAASEGDQPLDLSVKPTPAHSRETRNKPSDHHVEMTRHEADSRSYRSGAAEVPAKGQGHYIEYEQRASSGHHLQRLENSVDRYLPQPHYPSTPKLSPQDTRHSSVHQSSPLLQPPESPGLRGLHPAQSPVGTAYLAPHSRASPSHTPQRAVAPSPNNSLYQPSTSPSVGPLYLTSASKPAPSTFQRPPSHGADDQRIGQIQPHPQSSPSPDDAEAQRLGVSKHEPIQNIIGHHPPSDILYLICKLCRQTYGSPYGFRKHFRNQHGFEPKAEHTLVQTISATKTAMAHTVPGDEKPHSPMDEHNTFDEVHYQHRDSSSGGYNYDEAKKDLPENTKFLECPECGQTFQLNDFGSYKRHCRQHNLHRSSGPFACHDCQKSFPEPNLLQEHLSTHSNFTQSVCGICRTFFSSPYYLAEHLQAAHGHVYNSDDRSSDCPDKKPSDDLILRKTDPAKSVENSSSQQPSLTTGHPLPLSKRHRHYSPADSQLFTVHTPKGLEVQKLPADAVVTTASPDSSYDDARFQLDSQPASSGTQKMAAAEGINTENDSAVKRLSADSKPIQNDKAPNKEENESNSSYESNKEGSRTSSPGAEDIDKFYKHKKYSRHRKRGGSTEMSSEPESKTSKLDGTKRDESPFSVSSSVNSGVLFRDCESSCQHSEDSSNSFKQPGDKPDDKAGGGQGDPKFDDGSEDGKSGKKNNSSEGGTKFKWDRLTRSQAGKVTQSSSYSS
ncbi:uncharacterized protein LOC131933441 [Physella acuta]|uniref:uncharacterized protein LOC131933441 n=1 Tax=Physella acuta TaxID=109671 RepID=UPI0027DDEB59|nr:uncharacterized protein LOC131933441 [Physella acuta]